MNNKIKTYRKQYKLTQADLSKRVNVSRQSIVAIEAGKYNPSLELAFRIARQFDSTIEELFIFEEDYF